MENILTNAGARRAATVMVVALSALLAYAAPTMAQTSGLNQRVFIPTVSTAPAANAPATGCPTGSQMPVSSDESAELRVIAAINDARVAAGMKPLNASQRLIQAARDHSRDMAINDFTGHTGSDGSDIVARLARVCVRWRMAAENVGWGTPDTDAIMRAWMDSPPHRANILNPDLTEVGVGYASQQGSDYTDYWTIDFATE